MSTWQQRQTDWPTLLCFITPKCSRLRSHESHVLYKVAQCCNCILQKLRLTQKCVGIQSIKPKYQSIKPSTEHPTLSDIKRTLNIQFCNLWASTQHSAPVISQKQAHWALLWNKRVDLHPSLFLPCSYPPFVQTPTTFQMTSFSRCQAVWPFRVTRDNGQGGWRMCVWGGYRPLWDLPQPHLCLGRPVINTLCLPPLSLSKGEAAPHQSTPLTDRQALPPGT